MNEPVQILFISVVTILTILMVFIGWQIFQILSEIRKMMIKFNTVVSDAVTMTEKIGKSFQNLYGFTDGIKAVFGAFKFFKKGEK